MQGKQHCVIQRFAPKNHCHVNGVYLSEPTLYVYDIIIIYISVSDKSYFQIHYNVVILVTESQRTNSFLFENNFTVKVQLFYTTIYREEININLSKKYISKRREHTFNTYLICYK